MKVVRELRSPPGRPGKAGKPLLVCEVAAPSSGAKTMPNPAALVDHPAPLVSSQSVKPPLTSITAPLM